VVFGWAVSWDKRLAGEPFYQSAILMNLFHMPSFTSYNASKGILHRTFFFVAYNFCMVFGSVCMVFGAVFEVEVVEEGEKKNPEDARDKAIEKDVEEVMDTCKRAKGVEKEKLEEAGEKFEFVVEEAVEKEKPEEAGEKFEFVVEEAVENEKLEKAREKFEFVVEEAIEKEKLELDQEGRKASDAMTSR
jgi:hypothetical protein